MSLKISENYLYNMTEKLKPSIENLYSVFSVYPLNFIIEGCPCCVSESEKEKIHIKPLRELKSEDLSKYAFKAMTTWGNRDDFKHFLPRIFELLALGENVMLQESVILRKLEYGDWENWIEEEQYAIRSFLFEWWNDMIKSKSYFDKEVFIQIYRLTKDLDQLLENWKVDLSDAGFSVYVDCVEDCYNDLVYGGSDFKDFKREDLDKLINWIKANSGMLETGYFHFEENDKEFAEKISMTLYIFETTSKALK